MPCHHPPGPLFRLEKIGLWVPHKPWTPHPPRTLMVVGTGRFSVMLSVIANCKKGQNTCGKGRLESYVIWMVLICPLKKKRKEWILFATFKLNLCRPIIDIHYIYFFILKCSFSIIEYGMSIKKVENPFVYNWINQ